MILSDWKKNRRQVAYIGLGANLGKRVATLEKALGMINELSETNILTTSSWYESEAVGGVAKKDFINGVVKITTSISPVKLVKSLIDIEKKLGRVRYKKWGDRACDLDLLIYQDEKIDQKDCKIPHPFIKERLFVLLPLAEIEPELTFGKNSKTVRERVEELVTDNWVRKI